MFFPYYIQLFISKDMNFMNTIDFHIKSTKYNQAIPLPDTYRKKVIYFLNGSYT